MANIYNLIKGKIKVSSKSGDELICHCPFHNDTTPSFSINLKTGKWICFAGCGAGSFDLLLKKLGIKKNKIILPEKNKLDDKEKIRFDNLPDSFRVIESLDELPEFIRQKRFTINILRRFTIGFTNDEQWKDYIIIPIYENSKLITFQGRHKIKDGNPKYKNPKNSDLHKTFFNYDSTKNKTFVFLTEGVFDTIKLAQWGLYGMCSFGTSLSLRQKILLARLKPKALFVCFDPDTAGYKGNEKILKELSNIFKIYIVNLPTSKDVDELTKDEFKQIVKMSLKSSIKI